MNGQRYGESPHQNSHTDPQSEIVTDFVHGAEALRDQPHGTDVTNKFKHVLRLAVVMIVAWLSYAAPTFAATLLPPGEITFLDSDGNPLAGGSVYFYIPSTTTPKDTWTNADQDPAHLNTNPVVLDSAGRAIIYGSGTYRQIVKDSLGNTIWDQLTADTAPSTGTAWGGTSTGSANAQIVTAPDFVSGDGQLLEFIAGYTNTGPMTLNPNSIGNTDIYKGTPSGPSPLTGGEIAAGNLVLVSFDGTRFQLIDGGGSGGSAAIGPLTNLASATTTELCSVSSHNANITGTTTITSFGSSNCSTDEPLYNVTFADALTITYNASSLITPTSASITTAAGDYALIEYRGSSNWIVRQYFRKDGTPLRLVSGAVGAQGDVLYYSAAGVPSLLSAGTSGQFLQTSGAGANPAWATASFTNYQAFTASGTWTKPTVTSNSMTYIQCWGAGGGGGTGAKAGGGGGGAYVIRGILTSSLGSTETVTIGAGGAADTAGGNTTFGSWLTAYGGGHGGTGNSATGGGGGGGGLRSAGGNGQNNTDGAAAGTAGTTYGAIGGVGGTTGLNSGVGGVGNAGTGGPNGEGGASASGGSTDAGSGGVGGSSVMAGAGGAGKASVTSGAGGTSLFGGGNGGTANTAGTAPGGGGGGGASPGAGARGECRVFTTG